jgi:hypothetical protein
LVNLKRDEATWEALVIMEDNSKMENYTVKILMELNSFRRGFSGGP